MKGLSSVLQNYGNPFLCLLLVPPIGSLRRGEPASTVLPLLTRGATLMRCGLQCRRDQRVRSGRCRPATAVRTGDDLQQVAVGVVEIEPAPTVPAVNLVALVVGGVGPVRKAPVTNPREDRVEFALVNEESVVLGRDLAVSV